MDEIQARLIRCFGAVFPMLGNDQIVAATADTVAAWDSVASVTLFATIEEEFELEVDIEDLGELLSFDKILAYLSAKTFQGRDGATVILIPSTSSAR
jgi:acyl carrier protein